MSDEKVTTAQQEVTLTPDQAYARVITRQRDEALNRSAQLEVSIAQVLQANEGLGKANDALKAELAAAMGALAQMKKTRRR
jgi:hypothetical protein